MGKLCESIFIRLRGYDDVTMATKPLELYLRMRELCSSLRWNWKLMFLTCLHALSLSLSFLSLVCVCVSVFRLVACFRIGYWFYLDIVWFFCMLQINYRRSYGVKVGSGPYLAWSDVDTLMFLLKLHVVLQILQNVSLEQLVKVSCLWSWWYHFHMTGAVFGIVMAVHFYLQ